jgi:type I restriction enzyme S subunit
VYALIDTENLPDNAKIRSNKNDVLISKVRPNRGAVAIVNEDIQDFVVSGAFTVLKENSAYKKETLFVLLKTDVYKEWLLKYNVGTSYPVIKDDDILNFPIPMIEDNIQQQIAELIEKSFYLCRESERLLNEAKCMVEGEID